MTKEELEKVCEQIILANPKQAKFFNQGKTCLGFFIGQTLKATEGKADPKFCYEIYKKLLALVV
jgi:aspartyl-tRNA(Asn)/glutamyl-tRNA(Gln) amidotransferase subunit B